MHEEESRFSIISWNIAGIGKIGEVWDFLTGFDVILLQETWMEPKNEKKLMDRLDNKFIWKTKAAQRLNKKGRAKGGILVGWKKNKSCQTDIIEWEYGLMIRSSEIIKEKIVRIITVYINEKIDKALDKLKQIVEAGIKNGEKY